MTSIAVVGLGICELFSESRLHREPSPPRRVLLSPPPPLPLVFSSGLAVSVTCLCCAYECLQVGEAMKPFGQVQSVVIISDRGREVHRGIAFIAFARLEDAVACYKAHPVRSGKPRMTVCG